MMTMFTLILMFSGLMLLHNVLFPFYMAVVSVFHGKQPQPGPGVDKISVILPVFNEEAQILDKLDNTRQAVDHLSVACEVLVGCDGSEDATPQMGEEYIATNNLTGWQVFTFPREGKGSTLNKLVGQASGDLIVSTDADTAMDPSALTLIQETFQNDAHLGCLSCVPVFRSPRMGLQDLYWKYELTLREMESKLGQLVVVTGWLYAYRKQVFQDIPAKAMADDLWVPLTILLQGWRVRHSDSLQGLSEKTDEGTEVRRRNRVLYGGLDIVRRLRGDLLGKPALLLIVFSHKVNRWLIPIWLGLFLSSSIVLVPQTLVLYILTVAVLVAFLGPQRFRHLFCSMMFPVLAFLDILSGRDLSKWRHTRIE
jgi:cellulose synthase/poly-beta-1,6-N-acetylglucosamine synthase-like glycosyltransferase